MENEKIKTFLNNLPETNAFGERVRLVAATKTLDSQTVINAADSGVKEMGENKVQEFLQKQNAYPQGVTLHFIGHLQANKAKFLVGKVSLIQSVDSVSLCEKINALAQKSGLTQDILLQINAGREPQKFGFLNEEIIPALKFITENFKNVCVKGLMAVLPAPLNPCEFTDNGDNADNGYRDGNGECESDLLKSGENFAAGKADRTYEDYKKQTYNLCLQTRELYDIINEKKITPHPLSVLSMGMSHDYKIALSAGSNMIRIGEALFGKRVYPKKP